jgi:hypothetical protein
MEIEAQQKTELFQLRQATEMAETLGDDPLGELAEQLKEDISERQSKLKVMRQQKK